MRRALLDELRCPRCKDAAFQLEGIIESQLEITEGTIFCKNCRSSYKIENGIANFLNNGSLSVVSERNAMHNREYIKDEDGNSYRITDETIDRFREAFLSLPKGNKSHFFKKGGSFRSIRDCSERFYATLGALLLKGGERVLDIGAGFSWSSREFARKGCRVVALDISNYLNVSRLYLDEAYFDRVFTDMHDMPFRDDTFDIVFGTATLHHSRKLKDVFFEIRRVLKHRGRLVLINESSRGVFEKIHPSFEQLQKQGFGDTSYTIPEWKKAAREGGFERIKIDFLPLSDDYIMRHKDGCSKDNFKLGFAYFLKKHKRLEKCLLFLLILPRIFFRPKSWRMFCYK